MCFVHHCGLFVCLWRPFLSFFGQFLSHFGVWVILRLNLVVFFCSSVLHLLFELMFVLVFFCNCFTHFNFLSHYFIHLHVFIWQLTLVSVWLFDVWLFCVFFRSLCGHFVITVSVVVFTSLLFCVILSPFFFWGCFSFSVFFVSVYSKK